MNGFVALEVEDTPPVAENSLWLNQSRPENLQAPISSSSLAYQPETTNPKEQKASLLYLYLY
jgi:hypothetical protein